MSATKIFKKMCPAGSHAAISLTFDLLAKISRRETVVCLGRGSYRVGLSLCGVGPSATAAIPALQELLSEYDLDPVVSRPAGRMSPLETARCFEQPGQNVAIGPAHLVR